ncbi:xanthine dehydrogenase-like [Lycorma delicatula]|uniref:xanthine dehydrogenase-like n=1 Tax=Lycorma delicatula TaxID=130591 RepID=UPI003F513F9E
MSPTVEKPNSNKVDIRGYGNEAAFTINGKTYTVSDLPVDTSLNTFIREYAHLRGTKFMCREGGCGACIVSATAKLPDGTTSTFAVNSCLIPVYSCHEWKIETVESLGNKRDGYGEVQSRLASNNGTQCGYCSPGMVMNMYSLLKNKKNITMFEVENSFGGNICRCTGYRPILDAFKSLAADAPKELIEKCADIEEVNKICPNTNEICTGNCKKHINDTSCDGLVADLPLLNKNIKLELNDGRKWYRVTAKRDIFEIFDEVDSYMLISGNTAHGVYRTPEGIDSFIDISNVTELHFKNVNEDSVVLGANVTLTDAMNFFNKVAESQSNKFGYLKELANHIDLIANVPVRNVGTLAGNLSIKHSHQDFPSDVFIMLEGAGANLVIEDVTGIQDTVPLMEYLAKDMNKKVVTQIILPALNSSSYRFKSYKIMPRAQNAHAYVNAAFLVRVDPNDKYKVLDTPTIVFGSITPNFVHAERTETFLQGKRLLDEKVVQGALSTLSSELNPIYVPPDASAEYRKGLAISLFYKFILSLSPENISSKNRSGGSLLVRPLSSGMQDFETHKDLWPLNKPVPKLEAYSQCSGEAEYVNDIKKVPGEVFGAVVVAEKAVATSFSLDPADALKLPGVISFYSAKDIPGKNDFMPESVMSVILSLPAYGEEIFASEKILFAGQAVGVIIAESQSIAEAAAKKVKIQYGGMQKPCLDILDVIKSGETERIAEEASITPTTKKDDIKHKVKGQFLINGQYHYTMETQSCFCVPSEDGLDVYPTTQSPSIVQAIISKVLNIPETSINMSVRRLGGAYGSKISRNNQISAICALAAYLSRRPVRLILNIETNMQMVGKRFPCYIEYEVGVNNVGQIQELSAKLYQDVGATLNEKIVIGGTVNHLSSLYDVSTWDLKGYSVRTDTPSNTWVRAPGSTEAVAVAENLMEHIANVVKKDPYAVRQINMMEVQKPVLKMMENLKNTSEFEKRSTAIDAFNNTNRWKKRGISLIPLTYPFGYWGRYHANISIFASDGTVSISHGGIECGQGVNTKAAQVCAYVLGIPLEHVKVKPTTTVVSPNNVMTGGSITSESVCYAVKKGCEEILQRLEPIKKQLPPKADWLQIIQKACQENVNLYVNHMYKPNEDLKEYNIYGVTILEVEVDILTGQNQILRVDLVEDAGQSLSPQVDIGQVEGAFVMGLGYYLTELLVYDKDTGKILTDRTWTYKPPGAKDIPIDFRVTLLRKSDNPFGVYRSKATGEPPLNMSVAVIFAIRNALESARKDSGKIEDWFNLANPLTHEQIWLSALTDIKSMTL